MSRSVPWPVKRREMHNHHMNSTAWNKFNFREDDIVIATYAKSGTTWMQQIVSQLLSGGAEGIDVAKLSAWIELRVMPPEAFDHLDAAPHRRFVKTHLPVDALVYSPQAKYIYIGRDGRDAAWSLYNHLANASDKFFEVLNNTPGRVGPPIARITEPVDEFYRAWLAQDGYPIWPFWENVRSWWAIRGLPNLLFVHFNDLKADLPGSVRRIARFLDIETNEAQLGEIVEHCSFAYMKAHAQLFAPLGGALWNGGADTFVHKGDNGRWRDVLTAADNAAYESRARAELGAECSAWVANGGWLGDERAAA
jgi:aryl sulfotransferase